MVPETVAAGFAPTQQLKRLSPTLLTLSNIGRGRGAPYDQLSFVFRHGAPDLDKRLPQTWYVTDFILTADF
jgi:hypothetical protein